MSSINRRDFLAGASAILTTGAIARPVRSLLSTRDAEPLFIPTAADYVMDGLIAMWDGIENAGWGVQDTESTSWMELVSGSPCVLSGSFGSDFWWDKDGYVKNNRQHGTFVFDLTEFLEESARAASFSVEVVNSNPTQGDSWQAQTINICSAAQLGMYNYAITARYRRMSDGYTAAPTGNTWTYICGNNYLIGSRESLNTDTLVYDSKYAWTYSSGYLSGNAQAVTPSPAIEGVYVRLGSSNYSFCGRYHCLRIYNRPLTPNEVHHNALIDRLRFNLP